MDMDDERPMSEPTDEPMDESLRDLVARTYQAPEGAVPRDEMWARIDAARRATRGTPAPHVEHVEHVDRTDRTITPIVPLHRQQRTIWRWSAALAAGLVLGIAVDRALVQRDAASGAVASAPATTERSSGTRGAATESTTTAPAQTQQVAVAPTPGAGTRSDTRTTPSTHPTTDRAVAPVSSGAERAVAQADPSAPANDLYHAAAVQTLVQAEALLTAYRRTGDAAPDPVAVQQAARWARDVLSSTRLLMDSPAAREPRMRVLFSDLELVLAQIVQLSGAPLQAPERELIERALRDRDLLPRLRSAVPAGLTTS